MGRIQASTGLVTGFDIQGTIQKLMQIEAQPRDALTARQKDLQSQQAAITDLTALSISVQLAVRRLKKPDLFGATTVTSSNPNVLTATTTKTVSAGQYQFVPARVAQPNYALSSGVATRDQSLGGGTFSFRFGGHIDTALGLSDLNDGAGVARGQIKITDRSGAIANIDVRFAQNIDDVLTAINSAEEVSVRATADGDHLVLHDQSGGSGNLRVQEVGSGTTAAGLGLAGINVAADEASGQDLVSLFTGLRLNQLRDGNGVSLRPTLDDLSVTFRDGSSLEIDFDPTGQSAPKTLGDLLTRISAADPARLSAQVSAGGLRIELKDLTTGAGTFAVASPLGGSVAEELGLTATAVGDTITGGRIISGLKTTLLGSLGGGSGLGSLGLLTLTDRSGATANVNLASAESLDDVIDAINDTGLGINASYNSARNGIALNDTTGATTSNLIAADGDATNTATKLGLASSVAATSINSGNLARQTVSRATLLSSYNGGQGVAKGTFKIMNSNGATGTVNLTALAPKTIGDVIDAINALSLNVTAQINDAGDGISLIDSAGGSGTLSVADQGTSKAAANLHLAGSAVGTTIDGRTTFKIQLAGADSLDTLIARINELKAGMTASSLNDGAGSLPTHLSLLSGVSGKTGELLIDGSALGLSFHDLTTAQDALLQIGASAVGSTLVSSTSNSFKDIVPGLNVTLSGASTEPVTVTIAESSESAASAVQLFVDQYNKLRDKLDKYTSFNATDFTTGTLFGENEALHLDSDLSRAISGSHFNSGSIRSLAELGVSIDEQGTLTFDKSVFATRFDADPEAVTQFFTDEQHGFATTTDDLLESLIGEDNSLLVTRAESMQRRLDQYATDIDNWNSRLGRIQERLFNQFFLLESIVGSIKNNLTAISQIQYISPVFRSSSSS